MTTKKNIDFEVLKERWGKYSLEDGSVLKIIFILTNVKTWEENAQTKYNTNIQNIQVIYSAERLIGEPNKAAFTNEILQKNIEKDDVSIETLSTPVNEYLLDNRTKLKIFPQVIKVSRSSLKNKLGEPIYMVITNVTINFDVAKL